LAAPCATGEYDIVMGSAESMGVRTAQAERGTERERERERE